MPFLLSVLPEHLHTKVKVLYIQELVEAIRATGRHEWIDAFALKYGIEDDNSNQPSLDPD